MDKEHGYEEKNGRQQAETKQEQEWEVEASGGYQVYPGITLLDERDRQRQQLWRDLQELNRTIGASDGYRLRYNMDLLKKSYFVFDTNYLSLRQALNEFEQPMVFLKLWEEKDHNRLDLFVNDVIRLLHNFLAGAVTLLNHIHTIQNDMIRGADFSEEYRLRQKQQFTDAPVPRFVANLPDYMLHEELPFALAEINFGKPGSVVEVNSALKLDVDKLGEWEKWSEKGREYLNALDHKVKLYETVNDYKAIVADFYHWFVLRQSELYKESLEELEELTRKRSLLQQKIMHLEDLVETAEQTTIAVREEQEKLAKELEAERQLREREKARAERLEAALENTRRWWRRG